jgi:ComF family protein
VAPPAFDVAVAAVDYAAPWSDLITRFKFRQQPGLAPALVERLVDALVDHPLALHAPPDLVLPVPLSAERLRERGYNQAWELTRRTARQLGLRADAQLLMRTKNTAHQLGLDESARLANLKGAFTLEPLRRKEVQGLRIAVVDDVMTTGATAQELAQTLKQAGASSVQIWVVARTPKL